MISKQPEYLQAINELNKALKEIKSKNDEKYFSTRIRKDIDDMLQNDALELMKQEKK